jgi:hypothetical protein
MTIDELKQKGLIILECISGSRAYGLETKNSDTDIKGVFLLPKNEFYSLDYTPQVSNSSNDIVYYEFNRYMELLTLNNPNILELLNTPKAAILYKHPFLDAINSELILSKLCKNTFGKFALSQIKKARGLKKKIINPMAKERKSVLSFCYVNYKGGSIALNKFLEISQFKQENCGLINIAHMKNMYGLYHAENLAYKGIIKNKQASTIRLSSIPKGAKQVALLYFNKDGYSKYCKDYKEYWQWVENRNEQRYENTQIHGKNYDAKNMMHTFRLLQMATEIAQEKKVNVKRPNRDFLLKVKAGKYQYQELLSKAQTIQQEMEQAFESSDLPNTPDKDKINELTYKIRERFYSQI